MFWNNSRTFYNLSKALGSFGFLPLRGAGTGFVVVLPLPVIFNPSLYILHFTIYTTFHREATLKTALELLDYSVNNNTRVYQIHKEGGVANRFLTARRHFWTPWSERTHCMENGQSVFFISPHLPYVFGHVSPGGVLPYKGLMGTCGQPGYVFRDFCLKQGIDFINFCLKQGIFS